MDNRKDPQVGEGNEENSSEQLPVEIREHIRSYLDLTDLMKERGVSKARRDEVDSFLSKPSSVDIFLNDLSRASVKRAAGVAEFYRGLMAYNQLKQMMEKEPNLLSPHQVLLYSLVTDDIHSINIEHLDAALLSLQKEIKELEKRVKDKEEAKVTIGARQQASAKKNSPLSAELEAKQSIRASLGVTLEILKRQQALKENSKKKNNAETTEFGYNSDLIFVDLKDHDVNNSIMITNLAGADFTETKFYKQMTYENGAQGIKRPNCNFHKAILTQANLENTELQNSNFSSATGKKPNFQGANLTGCNFNGCNFEKANFSASVSSYQDVGSNSRLEISEIHNPTSLINASFKKAKLKEANFSLGRLLGTDFSNADLSQANLSGARLDNANFSDTNLTGINLKNASGLNKVTWLDGVTVENIDARLSQIAQALKDNKLPVETVSTIRERLTDEIIKAATIQKSTGLLDKAINHEAAFGHQQKRGKAKAALSVFSSKADAGLTTSQKKLTKAKDNIIRGPGLR